MMRAPNGAVSLLQQAQSIEAEPDHPGVTGRQASRGRTMADLSGVAKAAIEKINALATEVERPWPDVGRMTLAEFSDRRPCKCG